jgi:hypothetical protein
MTPKQQEALAKVLNEGRGIAFIGCVPNHLEVKVENLRWELVTKIAPLEDSNDDELEYVAYTLYDINQIENASIRPQAANVTFEESGIILSSVPIEAVLVYKPYTTWDTSNIE